VKHNPLKADVREGAFDDGKIKRCDNRVGEDKSVGVGKTVCAQHGSELRQTTGARENGIGTGAEIDVNARKHG
jgi:hypothetical protein